MNVTECLTNFGAKVIKVSPLLNAIVPLMDHKDKDVREEGKRLIIEAYRWLGYVMKAQLSELKPVQLKELDIKFGNMEEEMGKAKLVRWLRSDSLGQDVLRVAREDVEEDDEDSPKSMLHSYELLDPVAPKPKNEVTNAATSPIRI